MSSSHPSLHSSAPTPAFRMPLPPYAAPAAPALTASLAPEGLTVGPFVPEPWRTAILASTAIAAVMPETMVAPAAEAAMAVTEVESLVQRMEVPERIPPYRPLRPTPIMTPAIRTPLYIPSIPEQTAEFVPDDEGTFSPELVTTAEFPVPMSLRPTLSSVDAVAVPDVATVPDAILIQGETTEEISASAVPPMDAPEAVTPPASTNDGQELPWIEAFLSATPAIPMRTVPTPLMSEIVEAVDSNTPPEPADLAPSVEEWPLADAAEEFRALSAQLDVPTAPETSDAMFTASKEPTALPAWGDEDLMDIMPIRHSGKTPLSSPSVISDGDLWAERARKAQEEAPVFNAMIAASEMPATPDMSVMPEPTVESHESTAEEAAHALELLARRVRAGELTLPSYDPRMGEPAALVAALAALLGVRLR